MDGVPMKRCSKCGEEKPATAEYFFRDRRRKDGLYPQCKDCKNAYPIENKSVLAQKAHERYLLNRDDVRKKQQEYYQQNRQHLIEQARKWKQNNPDKWRAWLERNREQIANQRRKYRQENSVRVAKAVRSWRERNKEHIADYNWRYNRKSQKLSMATQIRRHRPFL
jgi:hypothetical protein